MKTLRSFANFTAIICAAYAFNSIDFGSLELKKANAQTVSPSLVITHAPLPENLRQQIYNVPRQNRDITVQEITGDAYRSVSGTTIGREMNTLQNDLLSLKRRIAGLSSGLESLQRDGERLSAQYYANVATINTQLQSGTTPGNPRLVRKLNEAETNLQGLNNNISRLNDTAIGLAEVASQAAFMLNTTRSAFALSGAVEEDHVRLTELEDNIDGTIIIIQRLLNTVSDSISRTTAYLSSERNNLRTLAYAVTNGDLYGRSLSNRPFAAAQAFAGSVDSVYQASATDTPSASYQPQQAHSQLPAGGRPLAKIRFDRSDVNYEQALYVAINEALQRYPNARFDLIAVHPAQGNAAEVAIESTRARRNAERVLRSMTQMGVPAESIDLSYDQSSGAVTNEVHVLIK